MHLPIASFDKHSKTKCASIELGLSLTAAHLCVPFGVHVFLVRKWGTRGKKVWTLITSAEEAYRKKAEADEALHRHVPLHAPLHACVSVCAVVSDFTLNFALAHACILHAHVRNRAIEDMNSYVEPSHILFCTMQVPELTRKLEKIHGAGIPAAKGSLGN